MRLIPDIIHRRIAHRPQLGRILDNIAWLFFDRALRLTLGLVISVWLARHLGPEQFGLLNYAIAFVALFSAIASLGMNEIVVRDLVQKPAEARAIMGTSFALQAAAGLLSIALVFGVVSLLRPADPFARDVVAIVSIVLAFKASHVIKFWFESQVQSRYVIWGENGVFVAMAAARIILILLDASLVAFAWVLVIEAALQACAHAVIYRRYSRAPRPWRLTSSWAATLIREAWPLLLAGLAVMVYMRIDQIMLGQLADDRAVGVYSAALRLSEAWYMIPVIIVGSLFPSIIAARDTDPRVFHQRMQKLFNLMVAIALLIAGITSIIATPLVGLLYGLDYSGAADVLIVHVWAGIFVFLGVASGKWLVVNNLQLLSFYRTALGAVLNILLNLALIPAFGAVGAAIATLISQIAAAYLFDIFHPATRTLFVMKTKAFYSFLDLRSNPTNVKHSDQEL